MGNTLTEFHDYNNGFAPDLTTPDQRDWITLHAELTALSIVEVERLWSRFQQLGCDANGLAYVDVLKDSAQLKDDIFAKNLMISMAIDNKIYFQTFLNAMKWADNASDHDKCGAIFSFFNQGNGINKDLFIRILGRAYPDKDSVTISRYSDILFNKLRSSEMKFEDMMKFCSVADGSQLSQVLDFTVIPYAINVEAHRRFSAQWVSQKGTGGKIRDRSDDAEVSDESLLELSMRIPKVTNWRVIGKNLGFSESQLQSYEEKNPDQQRLVLKILTQWKNTNLEDATCSMLRQFLGNNIKLNPYVFG